MRERTTKLRPRRFFLWVGSLILLANGPESSLNAKNTHTPESKSSIPNILVIYTDDQGYGDFKSLHPNAKFETPNLDRLARDGIVFTNGHSAASVCTPSRYSLLTGRYAWRTRLKRGVLGAEAPCLISKHRMTIASMLRKRGYNTGMVGKWHLGMDFPGERGRRDWSQPTMDMPLDKGFDAFFGIPASLNYGVLAWFEGRHAKVPPTLSTAKKPNTRHVDYRIMPPYEDLSERPNGLEVAPDFIDNRCLTRFTNRAIEWMTSKAEDAHAGKPFFLYLAYTSPHYPVCPLPKYHGQGEAGAYGEFMIETDDHIGRILDFLDQENLAENTLVILSSDNGPENSWRERIKEFSHDSRGGLREGKRSVYEGGHRVPMIARWPAGIVQPGRHSDALVGQVDVLATIADLLGESLPGNAGEDSYSFASVFRHPTLPHQRPPLISHGSVKRSPAYAITDGDWKLILGDQTIDHELYNLAQDIGETKNVAADHPDRVTQMVRQINRIIARGRTTPGTAQPNDTGYWKDLRWMTPKQYRSLAIDK